MCCFTLGFGDAVRPFPPPARCLALSLTLLVIAVLPQRAAAQCAGLATTPAAVADCAARALPQEKITTLDPSRTYTLAELIDIAEHNNPRTRIAWERAKQRADILGIERSAYFPILAGLAAVGDQRIINPFPKPLAPNGYVMVQIPVVQAEVNLQYLVFDFGRRGARVDAAIAEQLAAGANFIQVNQDVAFRVSSAYYKLVTAQERLHATQETLKTARTTQDASEARLANGRATLPDVLNARAETAQAVFDAEAADGEEQTSRVALTEALGTEPTPEIKIDSNPAAPQSDLLTMSVDQLVDRALANRPELMALAAEIRVADDTIKYGKADYKPRIVALGSAAQTSIWPKASYGELGSASQPTWSAALALQWELFDGGARRNKLAAAESKRRQAQSEVTEKHDQTTREVWTAYIAYRTALRKQQAATALFEAANTSYSASLDAYQEGVKNLIDVVTAEKQLAQARLSGVAARSQLSLAAVDLEFVTGSLLRSKN